MPWAGAPRTSERLGRLSACGQTLRAKTPLGSPTVEAREAKPLGLAAGLVLCRTTMRFRLGLVGTQDCPPPG